MNLFILQQDKNCFQSHWKYQLLVSNTSFLILIKAVEKYLQVFLNLGYQNLEDLDIFSVPLDTIQCRQSLYIVPIESLRKKLNYLGNSTEVCVHKRVKDNKGNK